MPVFWLFLNHIMVVRENIVAIEIILILFIPLMWQYSGVLKDPKNAFVRVFWSVPIKVKYIKGQVFV